MSFYMSLYMSLYLSSDQLIPYTISYKKSKSSFEGKTDY